ncbi:MAG TPA: tRNA lysidine(34) synthetase TilS [Candidatus Saccharimonadales bacterium]|nr:tRNA lysidine(34) synthetase TilS [Candidatus Saccharimonadales bacterium]
MEMNMPTAGTYVVAVSGGVDSVALIHALHVKPDLKLIVAHFDHGIRKDSAEDRKLVQELAQSYGLSFVFAEGKLGPKASEDKARQARYEFLRKVQKDHEAKSIITAHHQDDVLETAVINILRGTNRKGLTALDSHENLIRPLLNVAKKDIIDYAEAQKLTWREDSTNTDTDYLRNYVRHSLLTKFSETDRSKLIDIISKLRGTNLELDDLLAQFSPQSELDRHDFSKLPHKVAREVMATWLRANGIANFDRRTLERLVVAGKTARVGQRFDLLGGASMVVGKQYLEIEL